MSQNLKEAIWWAVAFVCVAAVIATGIRLVDWISGQPMPQPPLVWRTALIFVGGSALGGTAVSAIRKNGDKNGRN